MGLELYEMSKKIMHENETSEKLQFAVFLHKHKHGSHHIP